MFRVVHFEINAAHPDPAIRFYTEVFGWKIQKWEGPAGIPAGHTGRPIRQIGSGILQKVRCQA